MAVPAQAESEPADAPFALGVDALVLDDLGLPVPGARVLFAPAGCPLQRWHEPSDAGGRVALRWRAHRPAVHAVMAVETADGPRAARRVQVRAGAIATIALPGVLNVLREVTAGTLTVGTRVLMSERLGTSVPIQIQGGTFLTSPIRFEPQEIRAAPAEVRHSAPAPTVVARAPTAEIPQIGPATMPCVDPFGLVRIHVPPATPEGHAGLASIVERFDVTAASFHFTLEGSVFLGVGDKLSTRGEGCAVAGRVLHEDGRPAAGVPVLCGPAPDQPQLRTDTDGEGRYAFRNLSAGAHWIRAGGGDGGLASARAVALEGQTATLDLLARRDVCLRGVVRSAAGAPLPGAHVEYRSEVPCWRDRAAVREDGSFELPNLPGGMGSLSLWPAQPGALPVLHVPAVASNAQDVVLELPENGVTGSLRVELAADSAASPARAEVRVTQEDTGLVAWPAQEPATGHFVVGGLTAGWYQVDVLAGPHGSRDLGRWFVDGIRATRVSAPTFAVPGVLRLAESWVRSAGDPAGFAVRTTREACDVWIQGAELVPGGSYWVAEGRYVLAWHDSRGTRHAREFTVRAGALTLVEP